MHLGRQFFLAIAVVLIPFFGTSRDAVIAQDEPSFDDIALWLNADRGVTTSDGSTVTNWDDQIGTGQTMLPGDALYNGTAVGSLVGTPVGTCVESTSESGATNHVSATTRPCQ